MKTAIKPKKGINLSTPGISLITLGSLLILLLIYWIYISITQFLQSPFNFSSGELLLAHSSVEFSKEVEILLDEAMEKIISDKKRYRNFYLAKEIINWIGLALTASITIITGSYQMKSKAQAEENSKKTSRFTVLGLLGALASVCTLFSAQINESAIKQKEATQEFAREFNVLTNELRDHPDQEKNIIRELIILIK